MHIEYKIVPSHRGAMFRENDNITAGITFNVQCNNTSNSIVIQMSSKMEKTGGGADLLF